jgi:hypothetical protein
LLHFNLDDPAVLVNRPADHFGFSAATAVDCFFTGPM